MAEESDEIRMVLTPAERKERDALKRREAEEVMAELQRKKKAFDKNRDRLKAERLAREQNKSGN